MGELGFEADELGGEDGVEGGAVAVDFDFGAGGEVFGTENTDGEAIGTGVFGGCGEGRGGDKGEEEGEGEELDGEHFEVG